MAGDAELVAVGVAEVGAVIVRVVLRPQAGRAFGGAAVRERRGVRGIDLYVRSDAQQLSELVSRVDRAELVVDGGAGIETLAIERPGLHDAFVAIAGDAAAAAMGAVEEAA